MVVEERLQRWLERATMLGMAKKKREEAATDRSADRHSPHKMVRIPLAYHQTLRKLADRDTRTVTLELLVALEMFFQSRGEPSPRKPPDTE
jgi:hypothetical protein